MTYKTTIKINFIQLLEIMLIVMMKDNFKYAIHFSHLKNNIWII